MQQWIYRLRDMPLRERAYLEGVSVGAAAGIVGTAVGTEVGSEPPHAAAANSRTPANIAKDQ